MNSIKNNSILIGLTGGIASGKSTIIEYLKKNGYSTIDADKLGHKVLEPESPSYQKILKNFGKEILKPSGSINRQILGRMVFADSEKLKKLNEISHPTIAEMIKKEYLKSVSDSVDKIVFLEAALLIETDWYKFCDQTWIVMLDTDIAVKRLQMRDGLNKDEAESRINVQLNPEDRLKYADVILKNNKSPENLIFQTDKALQSFKISRSKGNITKKNI